MRDPSSVADQAPYAIEPAIRTLETNVFKLSVPTALPEPLAPAERFVPPVTVNVSVIVPTTDPSLRVPWKVPRSVEPSLKVSRKRPALISATPLQFDVVATARPNP